MPKPKVCVLRTAGTNCDKETAFAFQKVGAEVQLVHVNELIQKRRSLHDYHILALPGGFSYGDDIAAGKILANELRFKLAAEIKVFLAEGKLIIGICNGFQILVKSGLLPGNDELRQEVSLIINDSAKFEDRWVYLKAQSSKLRARSKCIWTKNLPEVIYLPVAHGEGKFVVKDKMTLARLRRNGQLVLRYCDKEGGPCGYPDNPNGSVEHIAGICDKTGRILGLMPHPERHVFFEQHPRWTQQAKRREGEGLKIFRNAIEHIKKNF